MQYNIFGISIPKIKQQPKRLTKRKTKYPSYYQKEIEYNNKNQKYIKYSRHTPKIAHTFQNKP